MVPPAAIPASSYLLSFPYTTDAFPDRKSSSEISTVPFFEKISKLQFT
jgi:hypothetical protein